MPQGNRENDRLVELLMNNTSELYWANVFHDTIKGSKWLIDQPFSPGRAAIGYPALYALYRILDEFGPVNILELGLGQSTKMIGSYVRWAAKENPAITHTVVEHDASWIDFFKNTFALAPQSDILCMDLLKTQTEAPDGSMTPVILYKDFMKNLPKHKYDFIFIDGPFGSPLYSRMDVIDLLSEGVLEESFILMLDDAERIGEQNTLQMLRNIMAEKRISYALNLYTGQKSTAVMTSENLHFYCTM